MPKRYKIFVLKHATNDATNYYLEIIREALAAMDYESEITHSWRNIRKGERVIVIDAKTFCMLFLLRPFNKKITWFQGVVAEEAMFVFNSRFRMGYWRLFEWLALRFSWLNVFVSEEMLNYFRSTYGYRGMNYYIMPCFNAALEPASFNFPAKYQSPSFVYAGNMNKWQCIDQMLQVYKLLEQQLPGVTLTLLTADREKAEQLVAFYGIARVSIRYCPLNEIDAEMARHKYGFILREDNVVNRVATPTKLSTYMANGVIPVITDVVVDFRKNLPGLRYWVSIPADATPKDTAVRLTEYDHEVRPSKEQVEMEYRQVFAGYFSKEKYVQQLKTVFKNLEPSQK